MLKEGGKTIYAGEDLTIGQGSAGRVMVIVGSAAHVQWTDGPRQGQVDLIDLYDLSEPSTVASVRHVVASEFDQSLDMEVTGSVAIRQAMDVDGEDGVIAALSEQGQIAMLEPYAAQAVAHLSATLRADSELADLLGALDDFEQEAVLARLAASLLDATEEDDST